VLGFQDETWWTRLAQPDLFAWAADPLRLGQNPGGPKGGGPGAAACSGVLRFCDGRPVSATTEDFLAWVCERLAAEGKTVFVVVWDNAAWHVGKRVGRWLARPNRRVREHGGCRIRVCGLPIKAPWLNPIEPQWVHGKRAVVAPDRKLTPDELRQRVCEYFKCPHEPPVPKPQP
jgi:transposase